MVAKLSDLLARDCIQLEKRVGNWTRDLKAKLKRVHRIVGQRWRSEAVKRVPVDVGTLKQRILSNAYEDGQYIFITEVGTNVPDYPLFVEFGTKFIAHGAVLALGTSTEITDAQAVKSWPAKDEHAIATSSPEQMPWLRPAFHSIRKWVVDQLNGAIEVPPP